MDALHKVKLRDTMHFAAESTREVVQMYISAVRSMLEMQPPEDVQQNAEDSMAAEQEETDPPDPTADSLPGLEEEPESPDPTEDRIPRSPPQPRESAETVRKQLLEKFNQWNSGNSVKKPVPKCLLQKGQWLLPIRMPAWLSPRDQRFHENKKQRVFVCDTPDCGQVVRIRPHGRCIGVRNASSRAPSVVKTGTISLPASEKKRGKSASSMPRGIVCTSAVQR